MKKTLKEHWKQIKKKAKVVKRHIQAVGEAATEVGKGFNRAGSVRHKQFSPQVGSFNESELIDKRILQQEKRSSVFSAITNVSSNPFIPPGYVELPLKKKKSKRTQISPLYREPPMKFGFGGF